MTEQTPWIERVFRFDFPASHFPVIFSRLEGSLFRMHFILANADEDFCSRQVGGWSVKEHVGHLSDLEYLWWQRLDDFRNGRPVLAAADMQNKATWQANHNETPLEILLNHFAVERQKLLETIFVFENAELLLTSIHPRLQQPMRLIDSLFFVAEHDDHHLAKISALLRKPAG